MRVDHGFVAGHTAVVPDGFRFDWTARRGSRMGLTLDPRFLPEGGTPLWVKVTYHDEGTDPWFMRCRDGGVVARRRMVRTGTGRVRTATCFFEGFSGATGEEAYDMVIESEGEPFTVSFVRMIRTVPAWDRSEADTE